MPVRLSGLHTSAELTVGTPMGLLHATARIYRTNGIRGLFQGHSATLLRIFPYAGVKFMVYDWLEGVRCPLPLLSLGPSRTCVTLSKANLRLSFPHRNCAPPRASSSQAPCPA